MFVCYYVYKESMLVCYYVYKESMLVCYYVFKNLVIMSLKNLLFCSLNKKQSL